MKKKFWLIAIAGFAVQTFVAARFQSRAWIDEIWVVFNPAYKLLYGVGPLDADWAETLRSWVPPLELAAFLKLLSLAGVTKGPVVLPLVRLFFALTAFFAKSLFILGATKRFALKKEPWLAALFLFFTPEFLRYAAFGDLAAIGAPFLLLALLLLDRRSMAAGLACLVLSCLLRYSFTVLFVYAFFFFWARKDRKTAFQVVCGGLLFLFSDAFINSIFYGKLCSPFLNYAYTDVIAGKPARDGMTPFYFAFEILWRFMTEPLLLAAAMGCAVGLKRAKFLWGAAFALLALHLAFAHKEYRYFYPVALLLAAMAGLSLQAWLEEKARGRTRVAVVALLSIAFGLAVCLRGGFKTRWRDYEIPSKLETWVGAQDDARGLLVYGWNGIYSGGHYTFHRPLPYAYALDKAGLLRKKLAAKDFNYVITGESAPRPCANQALREGGGAVYRCTTSEIRKITGDMD